MNADLSQIGPGPDNYGEGWFDSGDIQPPFEHFLDLSKRYTLSGAMNMAAHYSDIGMLSEFVRRIKREFPEVK